MKLLMMVALIQLLAVMLMWSGNLDPGALTASIRPVVHELSASVGF